MMDFEITACLPEALLTQGQNLWRELKSAQRAWSLRTSYSSCNSTTSSDPFSPPTFLPGHSKANVKETNKQEKGSTRLLSGLRDTVTVLHTRGVYKAFRFPSAEVVDSILCLWSGSEGIGNKQNVCQMTVKNSKAVSLENTFSTGSALFTKKVE